MKTRPALLTTFLLVAALALAGCKSDKERAEEHLQSAQKYVQSGDTARANIEFRNAIRLDPASRAARLGFAKLLEARGNYTAAYGQYAHLIERKPDDIEAITAAARLAADLSDWKAAEQQAEAGLKIKPDDTVLKAVKTGVDYAKAVTARDEEARKEAAAEARKLMAELPKNLMLRRLVIDDDLRGRHLEAALKEVDGALKLAPENRALLTQRLAVLAALKDEPAIEAQLKKMVAMFPGDEGVEATLLRWYVSQGKIDDAEGYLRKLANQAKPADRARAEMTLVTFLMKYRGTDMAETELGKIIASGVVPATPAAAAADDKKAGKKDVGTDITVASFRALKDSILFQKGQRSAAVKDMEAIVTGAAPSDEIRRIQVTLARMKFAMGDKVGARALVEEVLKQDKGQVQALKLKAGWLIDSDDTDQAIALLRTALEARSNDAQAMTLMARAYERAGQPDLAGDMLNQAVEASNKAPAESLRYAAFLSRSGRDLAAESVLIDALRLDPANPQLLVPLGRLYVKLKDWPRAKGVVDRLDQIGTPETKAAAQGLRPAILAGQQNLGAAVDYLQGLVNEGQGGIGAQVAVIRSLLAEGKLDQAKQASDKLLADKPDDPTRRFIAASVDAATGDVKGAEATYRDLLKQDPKRDRVWVALIRLLGATGQPEAADAAAAEGLKAMPESVVLQQIHASQLERAGKIDAAIAIYQKLYDQNTNSAVNANNLASLLASYKGSDPASLERAYTIARRLVGTKVPPFADTYGWIVYLRGNAEEAVPYLETAAKGLPKDPLVQYHLAEAYQAVKQPDKARAQFEKVVALVPADDTRDFVETARKALAAAPGESGGGTGSTGTGGTGTGGN